MWIMCNEKYYTINKIMNFPNGGIHCNNLYYELIPY